MDFEVAAWTAVFFGGDILILALLLRKALQADKEEKARIRSEGQNQSA